MEQLEFLAPVALWAVLVGALLGMLRSTIVWTLPTEPGDRWRIVVDTSTQTYVEPVGASNPLPVDGRSVLVLTPIER